MCLAERKIARCKKCNMFLGSLCVKDYLLGSKVLVDLEFRCPRCGQDNVVTIQIAPVLKKDSLPYL